MGTLDGFGVGVEVGGDVVEGEAYPVAQEDDAAQVAWEAGEGFVEGVVGVVGRVFPCLLLGGLVAANIEDSTVLVGEDGGGAEVAGEAMM